LDVAPAVPTANPALTSEIDRLETMVRSMSTAELDKTGVSDRLRELLGKLGSPPEAAVDTDEFAGVSDDDLFNMIDDEIQGMSS